MTKLQGAVLAYARTRDTLSATEVASAFRINSGRAFLVLRALCDAGKLQRTTRVLRNGRGRPRILYTAPSRVEARELFDEFASPEDRR